MRHPVRCWLALVVVVTVMGPGTGGQETRVRRRDRVISGPPRPSLLSVQAGPYVLLPRGQKIQVTSEENHLAGMDDFVCPGRGAARGGHRAKLPPASARATKKRVRVCIDGIPVGGLTAYMAEHFLPLIQLCEERGLTVACDAVVKGNQLKADVVLDRQWT